MANVREFTLNDRVDLFIKDDDNRSEALIVLRSILLRDAIRYACDPIDHTERDNAFIRSVCSQWRILSGQINELYRKEPDAGIRFHEIPPMRELNII